MEPVIRGRIIVVTASGNAISRYRETSQKCWFDDTEVADAVELGATVEFVGEVSGKAANVDKVARPVVTRSST